MIEPGIKNTAGPAKSPAPSGPAIGQSSILDRDELMDRMGGDRELLVEIVDLFLSDCPKRLAELREAVERQDAAMIARIAHAVKGQVANLAGATAKAAALRLEQMGSEVNLTGARKELASLEGAIEQLKIALRALCSQAG